MHIIAFTFPTKYQTANKTTYFKKPEPGDYSYSGMHDHGPLPPPKEGGQFAQIIGLVSAAKKASDEYLTAVIEKEKQQQASTASKTNVEEEEEEVRQQKRKRK